MGNIIEKIAFVNVPCSYDTNTDHLIFVPREELTFSMVQSYDIPVRHLHINDKYPTLLMSHGNSEDIGECDLKDLSEAFRANICVFDYAGYGLHTCRVSSESHCQKDIVAVYSYLINTKKINPEKIVIYGRSLGSGPACYLAHYVRNHHQRPQKLILVSPLSSAVSVVTDLWSPIDIFRNYQLAPQINCSTLILHGDNDKVVPHSCGLDLSTRFQNLYKFHTLVGGGHNNFVISEYCNEIYKFLKL